MSDPTPAKRPYKPRKPGKRAKDFETVPPPGPSWGKKFYYSPKGLPYAPAYLGRVPVAEISTPVLPEHWDWVYANRRLLASLVAKAFHKFRRQKFTGEFDEAWLVVVPTALKALATYEPAKGTINTYVGTCVHNAVWQGAHKLFPCPGRYAMYAWKHAPRLLNYFDPYLAPTKDQSPDPVLLADLGEGLRRLDPLDRLVVEMRYGLGDYAAHQLEEIARFFGVSKQRVNQRLQRAFAVLRDVVGCAGVRPRPRRSNFHVSRDLAGGRATGRRRRAAREEVSGADL